MNQQFPNNEKLKSKKLIEQLFKSGKSVSSFPVKLIYTTVPFEEDVLIKASVSVSKRRFKNAVDRNRIKRLLRESYRLNKSIIHNELQEQYVCMFLYLGKEMPNFNELNGKMERLLHKLVAKESK